MSKHEAIILVKLHKAAAISVVFYLSTYSKHGLDPNAIAAVRSIEICDGTWQSWVDASQRRVI
eukprot:6210551-Pleurochrysis_carterae.AAC.1